MKFIKLRNINLSAIVDDQDIAAIEYNNAARKFHKEFACLNKISV